MIRGFLILAAFLAASVASTADAQRVYNLPAGQYLITGEVRAVGPVISPDGPVVPPVDPVVPPVVDDSAKMMAEIIKALPETDGRHQNAIKFAGTLKLLADQAKEKQLSADTIIKVYSPLMAVAVSDSDWKPVHEFVLAGVKKCQSPAVCSSLLGQFAAGAMSTVPVKGDKEKFRGTSSDEIAAAAEEYGFDWSALLKLLLPLLLALLEQWLSFSQFVAVALLC